MAKPTEITLELLNDYAVEEVERYLNLNILGHIIPTPYYVNYTDAYWRKALRRSGATKELIEQALTQFRERTFNYGWLGGKGTPGEIEVATEKILLQTFPDPDIKFKSKKGILNFMKVRGIGVDCSGFTYNTLRYAFDRCGKISDFNVSLNWRTKYGGKASRAASYVFDGNASSKIICKNARPLDIVAIREKEILSHTGVLIEKDGDLMFAQSAFTTEFPGVTICPFSVIDGKPIFGQNTLLGFSLEELFEQGKLEFLRLKVVNEVISK